MIQRGIIYPVHIISVVQVVASPSSLARSPAMHEGFILKVNIVIRPDQLYVHEVLSICVQ